MKNAPQRKSIRSIRNLAKVLDRLRASITVNESGCHIWCGSQSQGYGSMRFEGKRWLAHRLSYEMHHGAFPECQTGLVVCHKCDVKLCCNPDHLYLGTDKQNARDRADRCLMKTGRRLWSRHTEEEASEPIGTVYYEFRGEVKTLFEWADLLDLHFHTLDLRFLAGWAEEDIVTKPHGGVRRRCNVANYRRFSGVKAVHEYLANRRLTPES